MSKTKGYLYRLAFDLRSRGFDRVNLEACDDLLGDWRLSVADLGTIRVDDSDDDSDIEAVFEWGDVEIELSISVFRGSSSWEVREVYARGETASSLAECFRDLAKIEDIGEKVGEADIEE